MKINKGHFLCSLLVLIATCFAKADDQSVVFPINPELQYKLNASIQKLYATPFIANVIQTAIDEKSSISVRFDEPQQTPIASDGEVSVQAGVAVETVPPPAPSAPQPKAPAPAVPAKPPVKKVEGLRHFGIAVGTGFPQGLMLSLVARLCKMLELYGRVTTDAIAPGLSGGATFSLPILFPISPTFTVEGGHTFSGDANFWAKKITGDPLYENVSLKSVSYDYGLAQIGLKIGAPNRFVVSLRGGPGYIRVKASGPGLAQFFQPSANGSTSSNGKGSSVSAFIPSGNLEFILYL